MSNNNVSKTNSDTLRPLKERFILVQIISAVAIVVCIYVFSIIAIETSYMGKVDDALASCLGSSDDKDWAPVHYRLSNESDISDSIKHFIFEVETNKEGKITKAFTGSYSISRTDLTDLADKCISEGLPGGKVSDGRIKYALTGLAYGGYRIAFYDMSALKSYIRLFNIIMILVGIFTTLIIGTIASFEANWVTKPLEESLTRQKQFTADASHELKTPLTVIKANIDILKAHPDKTIAEEGKWIDYIDEESGKMKDLIQDMLYLAKTDQLREAPKSVPLDLTDLLYEVYLPFESLAFENGVTIASEIEDGLCISGDETTLRRLFSILIDNALKYAGDNGMVSVKAYQAQDKTIIAVNNTGEAIPPDKIDHLFERFYRVDESRNGKSGGFGLGLSIAKNIVDQHKAVMKVTSNAKDGTTFRVTFTSFERRGIGNSDDRLVKTERRGQNKRSGRS